MNTEYVDWTSIKISSLFTQTPVITVNLYARCNAWTITYLVSTRIIYNLDRVNHLYFSYTLLVNHWHHRQLTNNYNSLNNQTDSNTRPLSSTPFLENELIPMKSWARWFQLLSPSYQAWSSLRWFSWECIVFTASSLPNLSITLVPSSVVLPCPAWL